MSQTIPKRATEHNVPAAGRPERRYADFLRACRFLHPHRRLVALSVVCALLVGIAFTSSLGTMLPIFSVLLSGDTVEQYARRHIVERRLDVRLSDEPGPLRLLRVNAGSPLFGRFNAGDAINIAENASASRRPTDTTDLTTLSDDAVGPYNFRAGGSGDGVRMMLPPVRPDLRILRGLSSMLPTNPIAAIACVLGVIAILTVIGNVFRFFQEYLSEKAAILAVNDLRRKLYDHVLHLPLRFFGSQGTSDVTSRLTGDAQVLQDGFKNILGQSIQEPIRAGMAFGLALILSWKLTLFIVLFAPLAVVVIRKFGKKMRRAARKALQNSSSMLGQIEGTLIGVRVVKAHSAERFERRRYRQIMADLVREQLRMGRIDAFNQPVMETLNLLVIVAVVLFASYQVLVSHTLQAGTFLLVMACLVGIGESLRRVGKVSNVLARSNAAAGRLFETLDSPVERPRDARVDRYLPNLAPISRDVSFEAITFQYPGASSSALDGVSLIVPRGQSVAVVGRNGSGKTTLLSLLPRFFDPQAGRIAIDGVDVRSVTLRSLRRQIGVVTQDAIIFPGTIAENIAYGQPRASRQAIESAARRAFAHDFILEKPAGYDSAIGEHGATLSGGQKQRIAIARAILRDTPILILDEATSQIDAESEHLIQQAIEGLMRDRTTFVIAHRFSTILSADAIVVMDKGQIVGQGRHDELLANCPIYRQLYDRQLIGAGA